MTKTARVEHIDPEALHRNPAFTNVVAVTGPAKTVYVGGQNALTATGEAVGKGDIGAQTAQIFRNLEAALAAAGAGLEHVIKWTIYVVEGEPLDPAFEVFQRVWGTRPIRRSSRWSWSRLSPTPTSSSNSRPWPWFRAEQEATRPRKTAASRA